MGIKKGRCNRRAKRILRLQIKRILKIGEAGQKEGIGGQIWDSFSRGEGFKVLLSQRGGGSFGKRGFGEFGKAP